jgi:nucleoside-diphosphate-sugar epimerase
MDWLYRARIADESPCFHKRTMSHLLIFGPGYSASHVAERARARGMRVTAIGRSTFDDLTMVHHAIATASHILSSVPPERDGDAVLLRYGQAIADAPARWVGYLSSTGVYGDSGGAWIDESAAVAGRRPARNAADLAWQGVHLQARVFRLPGIYGPGRSALDRLREGRAHRIALPDQVFSRIHVDDLADAVTTSFDEGPPGVYNIADDAPAPQNDVVSCAAAMLAIAPPPMQTMDEAGLSDMARAFYRENRRIANGKARRLLGWAAKYPDFKAGLRAC